jgi:hypothetical protein
MKTNKWKFLAAMVSCSLLFLISSCSDDEVVVPKNELEITSISPDSPATLDPYKTSANDRVIIKYDYDIGHPGGAQMWIRPFTNGDNSPGYVYSSSTRFYGKGSREVFISIDKTTKVVVDQLKIIIYIPDDNIVDERFIDVDFTFE